MLDFVSMGRRPRQSSPLACFLTRLDSKSSPASSPGFVAALAILLLLAAPAHAQIAESAVPLTGLTPGKVLNGQAIRVSHYNPQQKLRLVLAIQPPNMAEEEQFIKELTDKSSPNFHEFLTAGQWNARFAPSAEDEQKVVGWANSQGLTVSNRYANRLLVDVEAPAGVIEKVFNVTINNYQVGDEVDFANDRDPLIPASLSGIVSAVLGLQNIDRMHSMMRGSHHAKGPDYLPGPVYAVGPSDHGDGDPARKLTSEFSPASPNFSATPNMTGGFIDPANLYSSEGYDYGALAKVDHCCNVNNDSGGSPNVSSIAIVAFAGIRYSDVEAFFNNYGMAWNITPLWIDGAGTPPSECGVGASGCTGDKVDDEATVDTEYSTAYANSFGSYLYTAHVYLYEGANTHYSTLYDIYDTILSDDHAKIVTTSWDWTDAGLGSPLAMFTLHTIFNAMVAQGWTLINASGDQGSTSGCTASVQVFWPAEDPDFLAAGGTELTLNPTLGTFENEVAWTGGNDSNSCSTNDGGGGGGVSTFFSQPSWQNGLKYLEFDPGVGYIEVSGSTGRLLPDLSLNAGGTGQNYYFNGAWSGVLGTSIVAPELAAFFARENTYLNYIGHICGASGTSACTPVGIPSQFIYWNGAGSDSHDPFYDTVDGCNSNNISIENLLIDYCAQSGYDTATGWGSANMLQLAWGINYNLIPAYGLPQITFSGPTTSKWYNSDQEVSWSVKTINTRSGSTTPPPGVAGFTQGWDSIPADPYSQAFPGTGNSFYSGPQYPQSSKGCLSFSGLNGCSAAASPQGCHTAKVEAWDNQGDHVTNNYGPVCFDTVAPTVSAGTNPATSFTVWANKPVVVTLTATDPGGSNASGISKTYYAIDSGECNSANVSACTVYTGPFTFSTVGVNYIYYWTIDKAGNVSNASYQWISIDETAPATTSSLSGTVYSGSTYQTGVQVTLNASDSSGSGVQHTYYEIDGGSQVTYSGSAFTVSTLGSHSVKYWSVDAAGNTETAHIVTFSIVSPTSAVLIASPNPSMIGQSVTLTAIMNATLSGTPTGSVTFWNGATNLGAGTLSAAGVATLATTTLPAGALALQASYPATGNFLASNSVPFNQTVDSMAVLTSPAPGITLTGTSATFSWTAGVGDTKYEFRLGTTGPGSRDVYNAAEATTTALTTGVVSGIPATGATLYARIYSYINGVWQHNDYTYIESGTPVPAVLTSPTPGSTLTGTSATFSWSAGSGVTKYEFRLGTTGHGSSDVYNASGASTTALTTGAIPVPAYGVTLYARIYSYINGAWQYNDYTYLESGTPVKAVLTSPTPGTALTGSSATFTWTAGGGVTKYLFELGTTGHGSSNVYNAAGTSTTALTTGVVSGIPTTGATLYARLYSYINGAWQYNDYTYTEQ